MAIVNGYCNEDELLEWNRAGVTVNSLMLQRAIEACSRGIDNFCQRTFFQATGARLFDARWEDDPRTGVCVQVIDFGPFNDLVEIGTLKTDDDRDGVYETTWAAGDYQLLPLNPTAGPEPRPYDQVRATNTRAFPDPAGPGRIGLVQITGDPWGWPGIPTGVNQACVLHAARIFNRKESPQGVAGWGEFGAIRVRSTDPDVIDLLEPYQLYGGVAFA